MEVAAKAAAWRRALYELILKFLEEGGDIADIREDYGHQFGLHFDTFSVVGTRTLDRLGTAAEHMLKVLIAIHPGKAVGFYMQYIDRLLEEHEKYILHKYEIHRLMDCI